jgi:hypothetical protein
VVSRTGRVVKELVLMKLFVSFGFRRQKVTEAARHLVKVTTPYACRCLASKVANGDRCGELPTSEPPDTGRNSQWVLAAGVHGLILDKSLTLLMVGVQDS